MKECTLFFAGGGTGGHLFPGLAVADELRSLNPQITIEFIGSEREIEQELVVRGGYPHRRLPVEPFGELRRHPWRFLLRNWKAYRQARRWIKSERPSALIGLGGFASVPLVLAARNQRVPTILLEQNVLPGKANRWLSHRVGAVCLSFTASAPFFGKETALQVTGNPIRKEIAELCSANLEEAVARPTLLVLGGSQGAVSLNEAVRMYVREYHEMSSSWRLIHQTGVDQAEEIRAEYRRQGIDATVEPFFHNMAEIYRTASLVITRGGATTLAELACAGLPAVIVPYPHAAENHQVMNAREFAAVGSAKVVEQGKNTEETALRLLAALQPLLDSSERRGHMRRAMASLARPNATAQVIAVLRKLAPHILDG